MPRLDASPTPTPRPPCAPGATSLNFEYSGSETPLESRHLLMPGSPCARWRHAPWSEGPKRLTWNGEPKRSTAPQRLDSTCAISNNTCWGAFTNMISTSAKSSSEAACCSVASTAPCGETGRLILQKLQQAVQCMPHTIVSAHPAQPAPLGQLAPSGDRQRSWALASCTAESANIAQSPKIRNTGLIRICLPIKLQAENNIAPGRPEREPMQSIEANVSGNPNRLVSTRRAPCRREET